MIKVYENEGGAIGWHWDSEPEGQGRKYWGEAKVLQAARSGELSNLLGFNPMQVIRKGPQAQGVFEKIIVSEVPESKANDVEKKAFKSAREKIVETGS